MATHVPGSLNSALAVWYTELTLGNVPKSRYVIATRDSLSNVFDENWVKFLGQIKGASLSEFKVGLKDRYASRELQVTGFSFRTTNNDHFDLYLAKYQNEWVIFSIDWHHFEPNGEKVICVCR